MCLNNSALDFSSFQLYFALHFCGMQLNAQWHDVDAKVACQSIAVLCSAASAVHSSSQWVCTVHDNARYFFAFLYTFVLLYSAMHSGKGGGCEWCMTCIFHQDCRQSHLLRRNRPHHHLILMIKLP